MLHKIIRFFLENKLVTFLVFFVFISWGIITSPFGWDTGVLPTDPVPVDASQQAMAKAGHDTEKYRTDDATYDDLHGCCQYERLK